MNGAARMGTEIERKFLLKNDSWQQSVQDSCRMCQAYAGFEGKPGYSFRIRIAGERAFLTLKSPVNGISRQEYEYAIPLTDAEELMRSFCGSGKVEKIRHHVPFGGKLWEIDEFLGENAGLTVAELELETENAVFEQPPWLGREVTGDIRYYNSRLIREPFSSWKDSPCS